MEQKEEGREDVFIKEEIIITRQKREQRRGSLNIQPALKSFTAQGEHFTAAGLKVEMWGKYFKEIYSEAIRRGSHHAFKISHL